jgi:hypothetical protein
LRASSSALSRKYFMILVTVCTARGSIAPKPSRSSRFHGERCLVFEPRLSAARLFPAHLSAAYL